MAIATIACQLLLLAMLVYESNQQLATNSTRPKAAGYHTLTMRPKTAIASPQRYGVDFNPALLGGRPGLSGIRVRANAAAFRYASIMTANIVSQQIGRTQIPDINQCLPQVHGCVRVYNIYISYYRCPQSVAIYPYPMNRIRFAIRNFEIRLMGRLGGQVNVLLPLGLFGILCMDADQITLEVELELTRNAYGSPYIAVTGCSANVGYVNIYVINGGIVGFTINSFFRRMVSNQVRQMIPKQLCEMVPGLVNNMINPMLNKVPHQIAIAQMLPFINSAINSATQVPGYCYSPACRNAAASAAAPLPPPPPPPPPPPVPQMSVAAVNNAQQRRVATVQQTSKARTYNYRKPGYVKQQRYRYSGGQMTRARGKRAVPNQCAACPSPGSTATMQTILRSIDMRKIADIALSVRILGTMATLNDFTIDMSGEFSPGGYGGTPFGPFPLYFPYAIGTRMIEVVVSDFTINSLLFWMHRRNFLAFRIGPEMQGFGSLLSTTCGGDDYDDSDESNEVRRKNVKKNRLKVLRLIRRTKRQSLSDLEALGVCIGDIAPALAEKYPNRKLYVVIHTARAPSILISAARGGVANVDLVADATLFLDGTSTRVGNIRITLIMDIAIKLQGDFISGAVQLRALKIVDTEGTLGIQQDALDSIASLGKGAIVKMLNGALAKGMRLPLTSLPFPIRLYNMQIGIIEHGLYLASDIVISPSLLAGIPLGENVAACQT